MYETVDLGVLPKNLIQALLISDVDIVVGWPLSTDALNAVQNFFRRIVEVVDNDHFVVGFEEGKYGQGADVASATAPLSVQRPVNTMGAVPSDQAVSDGHREIWVEDDGGSKAMSRLGQKGCSAKDCLRRAASCGPHVSVVKAVYWRSLGMYGRSKKAKSSSVRSYF